MNSWTTLMRRMARSDWKCYRPMRDIKRYTTTSRNILTLKERGILHDIFPAERSPDLHLALTSGVVGAYCGFDPTADSLHIGNLLAVLALLHCQGAGHQAIAVLGGATALIGDPSGKSNERTALQLDTVVENLVSIQQILSNIETNYRTHVLKSDKKILPLKIVDNAEWYKDRNIIEFMSSIGRHVRIGDMMSRESVRSRLSSHEGMSFTEFSYQIFQAYDWLHLYRSHNCLIQIGGNDQMGNIYAGHDLISRITGKCVFGLTVPLVTTLTGDKLGKTAGNAIWLKPSRTSPFELYQFFINVADAEVERYLRMYTFLSNEEIADLMIEQRRKPDSRKAHKKLAEEVTLLVHGKAGVESAKRCTEALFSSSIAPLASLTRDELANVFRSAPTTETVLHPGTSVFDIVMKAKCFATPNDANRVIKAGGVRVNNQVITSPDFVLQRGQHILPNGISLIRIGKKNHYIIKWIAGTYAASSS